MTEVNFLLKPFWAGPLFCLPDKMTQINVWQQLINTVRSLNNKYGDVTIKKETKFHNNGKSLCHNSWRSFVIDTFSSSLLWSFAVTVVVTVTFFGCHVCVLGILRSYSGQTLLRWPLLSVVHRSVRGIRVFFPLLYLRHVFFGVFREFGLLSILHRLSLSVRYLWTSLSIRFCVTFLFFRVFITLYVPWRFVDSNVCRPLLTCTFVSVDRPVFSSVPQETNSDDDEDKEHTIRFEGENHPERDDPRLRRRDTPHYLKGKRVNLKDNDEEKVKEILALAGSKENCDEKSDVSKASFIRHTVEPRYLDVPRDVKISSK